MALLTTTAREMLATWWSLAVDGAAGGYLVSDIVSAAAESAREQGQPLSFAQSSALAQLAGYAYRIENATNVVLGADDADAIHSGMVAAAPWGRDLAEQAATPMWQVKFTMTFIDQEGNQQTEVKTSVFSDVLPDTIADLKDAISQDAQALSQKYGIELISATPYQILSVLTMKCYQCDATVKNNKWARVRAHDQGWFFSYDGWAACPIHIPAWVSEWRRRKNER